MKFWNLMIIVYYQLISNTNIYLKEGILQNIVPKFNI